jgi:hypothetical protein
MKLTEQEEEEIAELVVRIENIDFSKCKIIDRNVYDLGEIKSKLEAIEEYTVEVVCRARKDTMSWCRIGELLGISEEAAKSRFPQTD